MNIKVIDSGILSPEAIMLKDARLLENLQHEPRPILHFYEWEGKSLTYGYFAQPEEYLNLSLLQDLDLKIARRPTGGGIIFHLTDFAFSILIPAGHPHYSLNCLDNYVFINQLIARAILELTNLSVQADLWVDEGGVKESLPNFCMVKPTRFDLVVNGKKVGGAAQRRKKWGFLHQGSVSLCLPPREILQPLIKDPVFFQAILKGSYPLMEYLPNVRNLKEARKGMRFIIQKTLLMNFL